MPDEFTGNPAPLTDADYERAAAALGCQVAAVRAVAKVESLGGGYLSDGRPKILFERHKFHRYTGGKYTQSHSHISWPKWGGYLGGAKEYDRLAEAISLNREAALKSASWGAFQIMGFNHALVGFSTVEAFVTAMVASSANQLDAFVAFIKSQNLDDELRRLDWKGFARGYNGEEYWKNKYDEKMARAYADFSEGGSHTDNPHPVLRMGDTGQAVSHLQELLGLAPDGDFGPATKAAVVAFQQNAGLYADGVVGGQTWRALLASAEKKPDSKKGKKDQSQRSRPPLRLGDKGEDVRFLQSVLGLISDGNFGPKTLDTVKKAQAKAKLTADGVVGRKTWAALLGE
jgi:hypothetical protein